MIKLNDRVFNFVSPPQLISFAFLESVIERNELSDAMLLKNKRLMLEKDKKPTLMYSK
jgi:hypothetical protein